ncbi:uncharacterized protein LOC122662420 isoform X2 [Telopea speciosissima]|uniref:uncharacterized protein LOC122662420 isoform X2 n=1 Tax=Telopea speciosissima TaxID=54955 RepID=UPI001CC34CDC|nr:uncharacterized protein LOC122662420 isoform X2 [Telopea speciosissima]
MGSLEVGTPKKRTAPLLRSSSSSESDRDSFAQRPRPRFVRILLFKKVTYLQWILTVAFFFFAAVLFLAFLYSSEMEKAGGSFQETETVSEDWMVSKVMGSLDFGEGIRFEPSKLLDKFKREARESNISSVSSRPVVRSGVRKPQLALVLADLLVEPGQLMMVSLAVSLREIGYAIQVYSLGYGPVHTVWRSIKVPVRIIQTSNMTAITVDWLNHDGILVNSLEARGVFSCLVQEPFKSLPVIWMIHQRSLATQLSRYISNGQIQLLNDWKQAFNRATVVVFPNYVLPMMYSTFDAGNYFVIPGSPAEAWEADILMALYNKDDLREKMGFKPEDLIVAIVGSQFSYSGLWLEYTFVLQALLPLFRDFSSNSDSLIKLNILSGNSTGNYKVVLEAIARNLGYPRGSVRHIGINKDVNSFLSTADLVIYGSFLEEQCFPDILVRAMCFGKPIIAPDLTMIRKYVDDRVNGFLYPKENIRVLTQVLFQAVSKGKLSPLAQNVGSIAKGLARNLIASETIEGYASLLEKVLKFPSEVAHPKDVAVVAPRLKEEWQWHLFEDIVGPRYLNTSFRSYRFLGQVEELWNHTQTESSDARSLVDGSFSYSDWDEERHFQMVNARKRREEEELKDRIDQPRGTWEEVYRRAKRADRSRNDLHERDYRELERTGQPLCIYEPYFGEGTWPFLHLSSLYRGIGLSTKGRRPGADDVDAPSRLPVLNNPYHRDILGEYGAFFALANRIDRVHKNAWIGFQSWRATARKASLSNIAEKALLKAIEDRRHGDTLYFWVSMDQDPRNTLQQDFWSFCDAINAGNCRMFIDSLDAQMYDEHRRSGHCFLSISKDRHCYSRVLELLVNVWAYHSARRMVYVNPETGAMQEQHRLKSRRGQMWVSWFSYTTLKSMDEDLAEESDSDHPTRRWLWPLTGEVFWQGVYERERNLRHKQKERRKQHSKDKLTRMKKRSRQKTIGKYVKPRPEKIGDSNSMVLAMAVV